MKNSDLKKFAQNSRKQLLEQVATRLEMVLNLDNIETRERVATINQLKIKINKKH